jgi:4-hydroxythreonine-4-phosphate dehydrogenase
MTRNDHLPPKIAVTMGDPAGVGPEVLVKALADPAVANLASWIIVGDEPVLRRAEIITGLQLPGSPVRIENLRLLDPSAFEVGRVNADCGRAALTYVRKATELCLDGTADAIVTAPLNKEAVTLAGEKFSGHTEYIAAMCGVTDSRMLLANDRLRVVHVSTHVPLRRACELNTEKILRTMELGQEALQLLGVEHPRIAVCGLNPHAGEHGLFGDEDSRFIVPAVEKSREIGMLADGPIAADTVFLRAVRGEYDLIVAMYHDQGHIPMKLLDFEHTVNVTLGLPIVRTSVDHGTAFDIAGKHLADPSSMKAAMGLAAAMADRRPRRHQSLL